MSTRWTFRIGKKTLKMRAVQRDGVCHASTKTIVEAYATHYLTADGKMFSTTVKGGDRAFARWTSHPNLIRAAVSFGLLPREMTERLLDREAAQRNKSNRMCMARDALNNLRDLADPELLTPEITLRLRKILGKRK